MKDRKKAERQREYRIAILNLLAAVLGAITALLGVMEKLHDRQ